MIHDVDETLRRLLAAELAKVSDRPQQAQPRITFDAPAVVEVAKEASPRVNLYLHDVRENLALRDETFHLNRKPGQEIVGRKRAPVRLDLSYIVTAHAPDDPVEEHRLLADALAVLLRSPVIPQEYLVDPLREVAPDSVPLSVAQPEHTHANPAMLWQALGGHLRPALGVVVTVPFDPFETRWARVVREAVLGIGQGVPPHGPQRPLDMSSVRVSAAGVVTGPDGQRPLQGVSVAVAASDARTTTDDRGFFYILNLPTGPHVLSFQKPGYQPQEQRIVAPTLGRPDQLAPIVVALEAADDQEHAAQVAVLAQAEANTPAVIDAERLYRVALCGRLKYPDGRPVAFVPVRVGRHTTITDAEGVYYFFNLPPGSHVVVADVPGKGEVEVMTQEGTGVVAAAGAESIARVPSDSAPADAVATPVRKPRK